VGRRLHHDTKDQLPLMNTRAFVALFLLLSCGNTARKSPDGSDGEGAAGTGGTSETADPCTGLAKHLGVRYDEAGACLDTRDVIETGCGGEPLMGGYYCLQRKSDGVKYWVVAVDALVVDEALWTFCSSDRSMLPPPPCFASACDATPVTLCTQAQTEANYACGSAESEWDENCCRRPDCATDSDCPDGGTCIAVGTHAFWDCWPTPGNTCDCGGTLGGRDRMVCMP
jgi:hypothetical protein